MEDKKTFTDHLLKLLFGSGCEHEFNEETGHWDTRVRGKTATLIRRKCRKCGQEITMAPEDWSAYWDIMQRSR